MKRTRELQFRGHPEWQQRESISGLRDFDGEDLQFDSRTEFLKQQQKEWILQKQEENNQKKQNEQYEDINYAVQIHELNRMRGILEDEQEKKKKDRQMELTRQNQQLAKERKDREIQEKRNRLEYEKNYLQVTMERGVKQQFQ